MREDEHHDEHTQWRAKLAISGMGFDSEAPGRPSSMSYTQ